MKSNFKVLVFAIVGLILFSWFVSCRFGFGSGKEKWESSPKETEIPKENNQSIPTETISKENNKPTPISIEDRFKQTKEKREQLLNEEKTLKEMVYDDAEKKGELIFCTVLSLGNLYGKFLIDGDAEHLKETLKSVFSSYQSFFSVLQTNEEGYEKVYISISNENFSKIEYLGIKETKKVERQEDIEIKVYSLLAMRHLSLFDYSVSLEQPYTDDEEIKPQKTIITKKNPTTIKFLPSKPKQEKTPKATSQPKRVISFWRNRNLCDGNNVLSISEGKDTAARFFADDIVRGLKKLRQYNDLPKTFSRCETKLSVVENKLANIDDGKIEMDDDVLSQCETELNNVEQTLKNIKQETSVKITVEDADINQILSLFSSNKPSSKKVGKQPKSIGMKQ